MSHWAKTLEQIQARTYLKIGLRMSGESPGRYFPLVQYYRPFCVDSRHIIPNTSTSFSGYNTTKCGKFQGGEYLQATICLHFQFIYKEHKFIHTAKLSTNMKISRNQGINIKEYFSSPYVSHPFLYDLHRSEQKI